MKILLDGTAGNVTGDPTPFTGGVAKVNVCLTLVNIYLH